MGRTGLQLPIEQASRTGGEQGVFNLTPAHAADRQDDTFPELCRIGPTAQPIFTRSYPMPEVSRHVYPNGRYLFGCGSPSQDATESTKGTAR
jgi:hypothetical protein